MNELPGASESMRREGHPTRYQVSVGGRVRAAPARVYAVIADYREHHPRIIPPEYFRKLEVVEGGVGAGTRTRVEMRVLGTTRTFEQLVMEPEPGRVLVESNSNGLGVTTFTVDDGGGGETQVTITTELDGRPGVAGTIERLLTSMMLRRIYRKEIAQLAAYVARQ
jgi:hypothetical protein